MNFSRIWRRIRGSFRAALARVPSPGQLRTEGAAYASALLVFGDRLSAWSPQDLANIDMLRLAVRVAEFAAGNVPGGEKLGAVLARAHELLSAAGMADAMFDAWWVDTARPFIDAYVEQCNVRGAWVAPV